MATTRKVTYAMIETCPHSRKPSVVRVYVSPLDIPVDVGEMGSAPIFYSRATKLLASATYTTDEAATALVRKHATMQAPAYDWHSRDGWKQYRGMDKEAVYSICREQMKARKSRKPSGDDLFAELLGA